jgi:hypothetical protein
VGTSGKMVAMGVHDELLELERDGWRALSSGGEAAAAFYEAVLADDVLMLLPGGMVLDDRSVVVDSMRGSPWTSYELRHERVMVLSPTTAVVAYEATARRSDGDYVALFNSTYVRQGDAWRVALHQQTPAM